MVKSSKPSEAMVRSLPHTPKVLRHDTPPSPPRTRGPHGRDLPASMNLLHPKIPGWATGDQGIAGQVPRVFTVSLARVVGQPPVPGRWPAPHGGLDRATLPTPEPGLRGVAATGELAALSNSSRHAGPPGAAARSAPGRPGRATTSAGSSHLGEQAARPAVRPRAAGPRPRGGPGSAPSAARCPTGGPWRRRSRTPASCRRG